MELKGKKILIGISAGIAAYKVPLLVRLLKKSGADVQVLMTPTAKDFVTPLTLSTLSERPVLIDPFDPHTGEWTNHVELGRWADLMLFAPLTANTMGKMANAIADNLLVTTYLAAKCPVYFAPAMDLDMFKHPANQRNIQILRDYGHYLIEAQEGELASGLVGTGRMEEPEVIFEIIQKALKKKQTLKDKRIVVTAGPTFERIDPVRYVGNFSSGKMGFALAEALANQGADVTLISGPVSINTVEENINRINVESADEMLQQVHKHFPNSDILFMSAAVADYKPKDVQNEKVKKKTEQWSLQMSKNPDILSEITKYKAPAQKVIGFALETQDEYKHAREKLLRKNLDMIVLNSLNDPGAGFGNDTNKVTLITSEESIEITLKSKKEIAYDIVEYVVNLINQENHD